MHVNYEFMLNFIQKNSTHRSRTLDYGCGQAEVILAGSQLNLEINGADVFYEGSNAKQAVEKLGLLGSTVKEIKNGRLEYPDAHFDLIVNNQVIEHVEELEPALVELHRVLKPGGKILCLFPAQDIWWEGHVGLPLIHRFPMNSKAQRYFAYLCRLMGLGYFKAGKTKWQWACDACDWLTAYTHYRSAAEIEALFLRYFSGVEYCERDYILFRLECKQNLNRTILRKLMHTLYLQSLLIFFYRKRCGVVLVAQR